MSLSSVPPSRCPHCGTEAGLEAAPLVRHRCRVCGGPRVPRDGWTIPVTRREARALKAARRRSFERLAWLTGAVVTGAMGAATAGLAAATLTLTDASWSVGGAALIATVMPAVLALVASGRARSARRALEHSLDEAELDVARGIAEEATAGLTASELATALDREEPDAERLLARLAAEDLVRARVTDDGAVLFSGRSSGARVRVEATAEPEEDAADDEPRAAAVAAATTSPRSLPDD